MQGARTIFLTFTILFKYSHIEELIFLWLLVFFLKKLTVHIIGRNKIKTVIIIMNHQYKYIFQ
jgi:hypothetical protein